LRYDSRNESTDDDKRRMANMRRAASVQKRRTPTMSGKDKKPKTPDRKQPQKPSNDELYEDGDMATPKRDFDEEQVKEEEDKRM
jgi:hypothetical protein